jgi:site-specific DNA recombinase
VFDRAQAILTQRGEDRSQRRTNATDYLLTGRVKCGRCGQAYIGTAAHGRSGRYTYYTCFTRMRYGTKQCANDRLPADALEKAVTRRLWQILNDSDLISDAIEQAYTRLTQRDETHQAELEAVQRKLEKTRVAIDRYLHAFEIGTMPEDICAPRLATLGEQAKSLQARAAQLAALNEQPDTPQRTTPADLANLRSQLQAALNHADPIRAKTILQALVESIRVDARDHIEPTYRIPAVRQPCGSMDAGRRRLNRQARVEALRRALVDSR